MWVTLACMDLLYAHNREHLHCRLLYKELTPETSHMHFLTTIMLSDGFATNSCTSEKETLLKDVNLLEKVFKLNKFT